MIAIELIEKLQELDPMTEIVIEKSSQDGWHYNPVSCIFQKTVRMTEIKRFGEKPRRALLSCGEEKPNSFKVYVLR